MADPSPELAFAATFLLRNCSFALHLPTCYLSLEFNQPIILRLCFFFWHFCHLNKDSSGHHVLNPSIYHFDWQHFLLVQKPCPQSQTSQGWVTTVQLRSTPPSAPTSPTCADRAMPRLLAKNAENWYNHLDHQGKVLLSYTGMYLQQGLQSSTSNIA